MDADHVPLPQRPTLTGRLFVHELLWRILLDPTAYSLIVSNLIVLVLAISGNWHLSTILMIYLVQSVIIGVFNTIRILRLNAFTTEGFKVNGKSVEPTRETQLRTAFGFVLTYGFFHLIYLIFVHGVFGGQSPIEYPHVLQSAMVFLMHHSFSYIANTQSEIKPPNIGNVMLTPFLRILPMHLTIIFGSFITLVLGWNALVILLFLALKTIADLLMHMAEHFPWDQFENELFGKYGITKKNMTAMKSPLSVSASE